MAMKQTTLPYPSKLGHHTRVCKYRGYENMACRNSTVSPGTWSLLESSSNGIAMIQLA